MPEIYFFMANIGQIIFLYNPLKKNSETLVSNSKFVFSNFEKCPINWEILLVVGLHVFILIHPTKGSKRIYFHDTASKREVEPCIPVYVQLLFKFSVTLVYQLPQFCEKETSKIGF